MAILKHAGAGTPVPGLWCEHSMSNASFYQWRSRFGGIQAYAVSGFLVVDTDFII
ncbi:transposase [Tatumella ptyseos ATCC 33301]|uniref:Transposase n=1 Tax=Tatumella ptyseos ATCC 33301 TaxID=1005995 RepID=A0A085JM03_9GAMM|nr:transposase [Tatumella ptyseos ATCC 33301]